MRIKINGFRSHIDSQYVFEESSITLFKGPSGVGKSTIFEAIYWCLYGSLQYIYNDAGATNKCSVTIELPNPKLVIYRQGKPSLLKLSTFDNNIERKYEDDVAQEMINSFFGTKEVWLSCCYHQQNTRSYLLSAGNGEKMELLNRLSFNDEDPEIFIDKIEKELTKVKSEFEGKQKKFTEESEQYNEKVSNLDLDMSSVVPLEVRNELRFELKNIELMIKELGKKQFDQQKLKGMLSTLSAKKQNVEKELSGLPIIEADNLTQIEHLIEDLQKKNSPLTTQGLRFRKELSLIENNLSTLKRPDTDGIPPSLLSSFSSLESKIAEASLQQKNYDMSFKLVQGLKCEYRTGSLESEIQRINFVLECQPKLQTWNKIRGIRDKMSKFQGDKVTEEEVLSAREKVQRLKLCTGIMRCPHCSKPLRIKNQKIVLGETEPPSPSRILNAETQYQSLTSLRDQQLEYESLQRELNSLLDLFPDEPEEANVLSNNEIQSLKNRLSQLSKITIVDPPSLSPLRLKEVYDFLKSEKDLNEKKEKLTVELAKIPVELIDNVDTAEIIKKINEYKKELATKRSQTERRTFLLSSLEELHQQINEIKIDPDLDTRLEDMKKRKAEIILVLETSEKYDILVEQQTSLENEREQIEEMFKELTNLQRLKEIAIEVECRALQMMVDSINASLGEVVASVFDEPISIRLSLYKQLKTKDRVKPSVTLNIGYRGRECDSINRISGGEGDRISMAVALALSRLNLCPLLLLDECMSSLDTNIKDTCLKAIRNITRGSKTTVVINHEGTEGTYDNVIICGK